MKNISSIALRKSAAVSEYLVLMKPELTLLSVLTAVGSAYLALGGVQYYFPLFHTFVGTVLVGGGAGALNQYLERSYDALMKRTASRPLPSMRLQPTDALVFGSILAVSGTIYLFRFGGVVAGFLSIATLISYLFVYTPLKRRTPFATVIGGIPGALPPLIGWSMVRGELPMEAWSLFFILFFWQMPHFLALAWMYCKDYERAGYKVLTVVDHSNTITSRQILVYSAALIPASVFPSLIGLSGMIYFVGAMVLSLGFFLSALHLYANKTVLAARKLFFSSLAFLPLLFFLLMLQL